LTIPEFTSSLPWSPSNYLATCTRRPEDSLGTRTNIGLNNRSLPIGDADAFDHDPTPRASNEPWRFTPSLMDPDSFAFNNFANAPPGYYTPTPGGTNTLFHTQAGDLQTPVGLAGPALETPLSMPATGNPITSGAGVVDMAGFQPLPSHQMHHFSPFVQAPPPQPPFVPSSFVHQDTGYETMEQDGAPVTSRSSNPAYHPTGVPMMNFPARQMAGLPLGHVIPPSADKFRFHSTLNAPTAMIRHADEIPITYLNKGQAYSLSIVDTHAMIPLQPGTRYRTFVRVSFEDDEQRQKPGVCWSLWKEGRGQNEAHHRGGKLQAVEYVEAGQPVEGDDKRTRVQLETSSFDGFSVTWTPGSLGAPEVNVAVRFNFLSTDFSHSKGVKGIPVRLCAKTHLLAPDPTKPGPENTTPEICFCKVKLFRDHGAERKLSNDVAHVKKTIDKVKHQIAQAETGMKDTGKRKRASTKLKVGEPHRPGKAPKHKRTWSISSASSADGTGAGAERSTLEDDLHFKLQTLQDMFTSTRPVSVLYLQGEELDDPDLHPVSLPGDLSPPTKSDGTREGQSWQVRSGQSSNADSMVSPSPSSLSLASNPSAPAQGAQWPKVESAMASDPAHKALDQPTKVKQVEGEGGLSGWIEALGVDPSYQPPAETRPKPIACFYIVRPNPTQPQKQEYHRAVYLTERSLRDFNQKVAAKFGLDAAKIGRTLHRVHDGIEVEIDDDDIRELREGQDMKLEVETVAEPVKREWEMAVDSSSSIEGTGQLPNGHHILRFTF
jgi:hypothetical protein